MLPLKGEWEGFWRVRAGEHRIMYCVDEDAREVTVAHVRPRAGAYD